MNWTEPDGIAVVILDADAVRRRNGSAGSPDDHPRDAEDVGILRRIGGVALHSDTPRSAVTG